MLGHPALGFGQELGKAVPPVSQGGHGIEGGVPGLLHGEEHPPHRVPDPDRSQAQERAELGHQRAGGQAVEGRAVGTVVDRTGQRRGDLDDVIDPARGAQSDMVEGDDHAALPGEVLRHAVARVAGHLEIEVCRRGVAAGQAAPHHRRPRLVGPEGGMDPAPDHDRTGKGNEIGHVDLDLSPERHRSGWLDARHRGHRPSRPSPRRPVTRPTVPRRRLHRPAACRSRPRRSRARP